MSQQVWPLPRLPHPVLQHARGGLNSIGGRNSASGAAGKDLTVARYR